MSIKRNYRENKIEMSFADWADILDHLEMAETIDQKEFAKSVGETIGESISFEAPNETEECEGQI